MTGVDVLGLVSGAVTTFAFLPQFVKILKTRSAGDLSYWTLVGYVSGMGGWLVFGFMKGEIAIMIWNSVSFALNAAILAVKVLCDRHEAAARRPGGAR